MYEDSWYSYVPDVQPKRGPSQNTGHRRKESLLQQPNVRARPQSQNPQNRTDQVAPQGAAEVSNNAEPLDDLYEVESDSNSPPDPTIARRAKSYSSFYDIVQAQLSEDGSKNGRKKRRKDYGWDALDIVQPEASSRLDDGSLLGPLNDELLEARQQEYLYVFGDIVLMRPC